MFPLVPYPLFESTAKGAKRNKKSDWEVLLELDYEGIEFPVSVKDYSKREWKNTIKINVFKQFYKLPYSRIQRLKWGCFEPAADNKGWDQRTRRNIMFWFMFWLFMVINGEQAIRMPQKGNNILRIQNCHKQMPVQFVIYADFEAITEKIQRCQPNNTQSYTESY